MVFNELKVKSSLVLVGLLFVVCTLMFVVLQF